MRTFPKPEADVTDGRATQQMKKVTRYKAASAQSHAHYFIMRKAWILFLNCSKLLAFGVYFPERTCYDTL